MEIKVWHLTYISLTEHGEILTLCAYFKWRKMQRHSILPQWHTIYKIKVVSHVFDY